MYIGYRLLYPAMVTLVGWTNFFGTPSTIRSFNILPLLTLSKACLKSLYTLCSCILYSCRSQWPRGLWRWSSSARLLRSWVRIPPRAWMFVCYECCVLSVRGLCDGMITRPEESYRLWRVVVCDQETSYVRRLKPARGL